MLIVAIWRGHAAAFFASCGVLISSFILLITAFVFSDFSLHLVVQHSSSLKPLLYKFTATWANHEGSMLMLLTWCAIAGIWGAVAFPFQPFMRVYACILLGLLLYVGLISNPFLPADMVYMDGFGLNPLLQDIGLAIHPPVLYAGYACTSLLYALALWSCREKDPAIWLPAIKQVTHIGLAFLTAGIGLGSWWAYRELGWGGVWFWDPVENISLLPWLMLVALLHLLHLSKNRQHLTFVRLLAAGAFVLVLFGLFYVRSGLLSSVHSFASSPARGIALAVLAATSAIGLYFAIRHMQPQQLRTKIKRRLAGQLLMAAVMLILMLVLSLLIGISYPVITTLLGAPVHVGVAYYAGFFAPIACLLALGCVLLPYMRLKRALFLPKKWRMHLAHAGFLLLLVGVVLYVRFSYDAEWLAQLSQPHHVEDSTIRLGVVEDGSGTNYAYRRANFDADGSLLQSERRIYVPSGTITHEAGITYGILKDQMVIIGEGDAASGIAVRYYVRFGVSLLWLGAIMMMVGVWPVRKRK